MQVELDGQECLHRNIWMKKVKQKPPHLLHKWTVQRNPAQLGSLDQGGLCHLYVSTEAKFLRNGHGSDHQEQPSASQKVLK